MGTSHSNEHDTVQRLYEQAAEFLDKKSERIVDDVIERLTLGMTDLERDYLQLSVPLQLLVRSMVHINSRGQSVHKEVIATLNDVLGELGWQVTPMPKHTVENVNPIATNVIKVNFK